MPFLGQVGQSDSLRKKETPKPGDIVMRIASSMEKAGFSPLTNEEIGMLLSKISSPEMRQEDINAV